MPTPEIVPKASVAIIGGGPAGIAAAIQLVRQGIDAVLFEGDTPGGLIAQAGWIENYPGFPAGISGEELVRLFRDHLSGSSIEVRNEEISSLDFDPETRLFSVVSSRGPMSASHVVVATGTKPKALPFPAPDHPELFSRVFFDWRKIPSHRRSRTAVIGAGDIALDYALSLSPKHDVLILCRGEKGCALPLLQKRVRETGSIEIFRKSEIKQMTPGPAGALHLSGKISGNDCGWDADYVLCAVGREARKDFFSPRLKRLEKTLTAAGTLFLAGDVKNGKRRQIGLAVGDGMAAAMAIAGLSVRRDDASRSKDD